MMATNNDGHREVTEGRGMGSEVEFLSSILFSFVRPSDRMMTTTFPLVGHDVLVVKSALARCVLLWLNSPMAARNDFPQLVQIWLCVDELLTENVLRILLLFSARQTIFFITGGSLRNTTAPFWTVGSCVLQGVWINLEVVEHYLQRFFGALPLTSNPTFTTNRR